MCYFYHPFHFIHVIGKYLKVNKSYIRYQQSKYLADLLIIATVVFIGVPFVGLQDLEPSKPYLYLLLLLTIVSWYTASFFSRLYADRRTNKFAEEIISTSYNSLLFTILLAAFLYFFMKWVNEGSTKVVNN